jgi:hypothetical protein
LSALHRRRADLAGGATRRFLIFIVHAAVSGARRLQAYAPKPADTMLAAGLR